MKTRLSLRATLCLLAVLFAACAPAPVTESPAQSAPPVVGIAPSATPVVVVPTFEAATQAPVADVPTALPIATSRGPHLEATDPKTVSMASGNLQFVEFFEFW